MAYFKYNNTDAYVKKSNLKIVNNTPIEVKGSIILKYLDGSTNNEIYSSETISNLSLGTYGYEAKDIYGYKLTSTSPQSVTLTEATPNQTITFYYKKILGTITIKYINEDTNEQIYSSTIIDNLELGSYTYGCIDISGYTLNDDESKTVTLTENNPNVSITFKYNEILGTVTIKYILSETLEELSPTEVISGLHLGTYSYEAKDIDCYDLKSGSTISITLTDSNPTATIAFEYSKIEIPEDLNWNEVPYISTYYIKPVVKPGEEVFIDYYITDYYQKEYQKEEYTESFTVTVRIEGQSDRIYHNLLAGDHQVSLGSFENEGEQKFSIICTDKYGRNSHELFNFFLIQGEVEVKEYIMTEEDLKVYNIKNTDNYEVKQIIDLSYLTTKNSTTVKAALVEAAANIIPESKTYVCVIADTDGDGTPNNWWGENQVVYANDYDKDAVLEEATTTRIGLQKLLDDKKSEGYNKLTLLVGTYRIDHKNPIYIPTQFTLNLNGSTFKQNQVNFSPSNYSFSTKMIEINNCINSHVSNGIIEGDYFTHDYVNFSSGSEWINGIYINSSSKYCSYDNLIVKDIVGYGSGNGLSISRDGSLGYTYLNPINIGNTFKLGDIDRKTGLSINSMLRTTCDFISIGTYYNIGYLIISRYLGYQGRAFNSWNLICHFYDVNKNFIKSIDGYQYRRIRIPKNARFIRITITTSETPSDLSIQYFRLPCHCSFKNINYYNCRCCALAPHGMNDMLIDNCEFSNSGQTATSCAFDAEDGWDMMQDCFFKRLNLHDNPKVDWFAAAGHNFVVEYMTHGKINFSPRCNSYVLRNCESIIIAINGLGRNDRVGTGYTRMYNNIIDYHAELISNYSNWPAIMKDCTINGSSSVSGNSPETCYYLRCNIGESLDKSTSYTTGMGFGNYISCYIHDKYGYNISYSFGLYKNCKFENIKGNFSSELIIQDSELNNINLSLKDSYIITISLSNCKINNFYFDGTADYLKNRGINILIDNCKITNDTSLFNLQYYLTNKPITINNTTFTSNTNDGLIVLQGWGNNDYTKDENSESRIITLTNNTITMYNANYIISGSNINTTTSSNKLNIVYENNIVTPTSISLYNLNVSKSLYLNLV